VGRDRQIGPLGTATRVAGGLLAIAAPLALGEIGLWELGAALLALPLIATAAAVLVAAWYRRFAPDSLARKPAICSGPGCTLTVIVVAIAFALSSLTPVSMAAFWLWIGASLLLAAARGYGGCELLAFPNALTGRREQIGCIIYTPIDAAEAGRARARRPSGSPGGHRIAGRDT
jgi:hypothetical protein